MFWVWGGLVRTPRTPLLRAWLRRPFVLDDPVWICSRTACCPIWKFNNGWKKFRGQPNWTSSVWLSEEFFIQLFPNLTTMFYFYLFSTDFTSRYFLPRRHSSKIFNHALVLFNVFLFTIWILCRSSSSFCTTGNLPSVVTLISLAKIQRKLWQFLRKLCHFLKMDSGAPCSCHVMSRHCVTRYACFALIGWFLFF